MTFGRVVKAAQHGLPELDVSVNTKRSVATIRIPTYGRDLAGHIRAEVVRLLRENVSVIDVFLDLSARGTGRVADALDEAGFIFSGVLPGGPSGDWLIMQFFNGVMVDYDAIQVEDPATAELLAYIRANDPLAQ